MSVPLYIFDLDGTLALDSHRVHYLEDKSDPDRWNKYYDACDKDVPNEAVVKVFNGLLSSGADIFIFTGRSIRVSCKTVQWLNKHTSFFIYHGFDNIQMRREKDYTADFTLKREWYESMLLMDRERLVGVFEDRTRVVNMWRSLGITCFQVAAGDF